MDEERLRRLYHRASVRVARRIHRWTMHSRYSDYWGPQRLYPERINEAQRLADAIYALLQLARKD